MALVEHWPFFGLRVRTPCLELRGVDDELGLALGELATKGVHDPAVMPFSVPWTDTPVEELPRQALQFYWSTRAELRPDHWHLALAVVVADRVVGGCSLGADDFALRRSFETGSWLGLEHQGGGLGTELRQACLHLGFAGLGGDVAVTAAFEDNAASLGVTRRLGYEPNVEDVLLRRGTEPARMLRFLMRRSDWEARLRRDDIEVDGLEPCLPLLGAAPPEASAA